MKITGLYGFSPKLPAFQGRASRDMVAILQQWGVQVVFGGYDDPAFLAAAHEAGLQVMAEFGCFVGERWWERYPQSRPLTAAGDPLPKQEGYAGVNPTDPNVRREQLDALTALVSQAEIDGVWLDFIRWPSRWESPRPTLYQTSFDPDTLARFLADTGISLPADASGAPAARWIASCHAAEWSAWRCAQITSFVAQAAQIVREHARRPCILGLFAVPWRRSDFDGALIGIMGQDLAALAAHVDVISPMVYHRMCGQPVPWIAEVTAEHHSLTGKPIWPIIQTMSEPDRLNAAELRAAMETARSAEGSKGVLLFTLKALLDEGKIGILDTR